MLNLFQFIRGSMLVLCFYFTIIWPKALPKRQSLPKCAFSRVKLIPIFPFNATQDKLFIFDFVSLFCLFIKLIKNCMFTLIRIFIYRSPKCVLSTESIFSFAQNRNQETFPLSSRNGTTFTYIPKSVCNKTLNVNEILFVLQFEKLFILSAQLHIISL